jgi:hypothetical protein
VELTAQTIDGYPITDLPTGELKLAQRDLNACLAVSVTGSPANFVIRRCRNAVAAELDKRQETAELETPGLQPEGGLAMLALLSDHRRAVKIFRSCSCGAAFPDVTGLDEHLGEFSDDGGHDELALDLDTLVRFGIRRFRAERGLSMDQMGELLGIDKSAVSRIESGKRHAVGWGRTPRTVAVLLGVEVRELLRVCEHCGYWPPDGYTCAWCGMPGAA